MEESKLGAGSSAAPASSSGSNIMSRMALNDNKAGMEGLDKERINQIIYEASKDSKFFENEKRKEEQLEARIKEQQSRMAKITQAQLSAAEQEATKALDQLEEERDLSHTIVHVDMDAFYAAVEMRDDPSLRDKPMAVGGMGMLSTSNYLARRFGVRAAMPGFIGLKLCPNLVMVKPNFEKYQAVSKDIRDVMSLYDPDFCPMSLDEAYLDLTNHLQQRQLSPPISRMFLLRQTGSHRHLDQEGSFCVCDLNSVLRSTLLCLSEFGDHGCSDDSLQAFLDTHEPVAHPTVCDVCGKPFPSYTCKLYGLTVEDAVLELRNRIEQRTQLTASAGIAPNTMLAKVCSDRNKPNGQYRIRPDQTEVADFIKDLPIRKISGIGKVTEKLLGSLGVVKCSDIVTHKAMLYHLFSPTSFHHFMRISAGIGSTCVERDGERKSISTERTFSEISKPAQLMEKCQELCQSLAEDMKDRVLGKTLTLKIKTIGFKLKTRSHSLAHFTNEEGTLLKAAQMLLQTEIDAASPSPLRLRLMGVRMSKLCPEGEAQVSVADMFKRLSKGKPESPEAGNVLHPDSSGSLHGGQTPGNAWSEDGLSLDGYYNQHHAEGSDSEDDSAHFRLPLDQVVSIQGSVDLEDRDGKVWESKQGRQSGKGKGLNKPSPDGKAGILKFVQKCNPPSGNIAHGREGKDESEFAYDVLSVTPSQGRTGASNDMTFFSANGSGNKVDGPPSSASRSEKCSPSAGFFLQTSKSAISAESTASSSKGQSDPSIWEFNGRFDDSEQTMSPSSSLGNQETGMVSCPVCRQQKLNWPLDQLNSHIDLCLTRQTVRDILQEEKVNQPNQVLGVALKDKVIKRPGTSHASTHKDKRQKAQPSVISYFKS